MSKRYVFRALCYHCSRDLCLDHLTQHAQLIDDWIRSQLKDYFTNLNEVASNLQSLAIPSNILNEPVTKLEQWRRDAYRQIDEIVTKKLQEVQMKIEEYRQIFDRLKNEQMEKINRYKQKISELFRKSQIAQKDLSHLKRAVEQIQTDLTMFDKHSIEIISARPLTSSIHVRLRCNEWKPPSPSSSSSSSLSSIIRQFEFRLKYVRLSGIITSHDLLVGVNGTIADLIEQFALQQDRMKTKDHKPQYYLATEVCQHRIRQRFTNETSLRSIFNRIESLVLYETPFELNSPKLQEFCLILCRFEEGLPWEIRFGLPFLLTLPRFQCRGRDVIDLLDQTLKTYFPLLDTTNNLHYELRLHTNETQNDPGIILKEWAEQVIDEHLSMADNVTLVINIIHHDQMHLARRDGITRISDKRRKSRK